MNHRSNPCGFVSIVCLFVVLSACSTGDDGVPTEVIPANLEAFAGTIDRRYADGFGTEARFSEPEGVATDNAGNLYVADTGNNTIRKITSAGVVTRLAGSPGRFGSVDGVDASALFDRPQSIATDSAGNVYVADTFNNTIRKITSDGMVTTFAGSSDANGSQDGPGAAARFMGPSGIAIDRAGNLYVADQGNHTVRKISPAGVVSTLAGSAGVAGSADGAGAAARFWGPVGVATDSVGNVYVSDTYNNTIRTITPEGVVSTLAGAAGHRGSSDGTGELATFYLPQGIAVDVVGNVYVVDTSNNSIRKITSSGAVSTLVGASATPQTGGSGLTSGLSRPIGIAADSVGNVYVADTGHHIIRKITSLGVVTTLAGLSEQANGADGFGADASFLQPIGICTDSAGNVYIADTHNHTVRKITSTGVVSTLVGKAGIAGHANGTGTQARLNSPQGIVMDRAGNAYVADTGNHTIRKITPSGVVTTLAGTAGVVGSIDGVGVAARFGDIQSVAIDYAGNLYVADSRHHVIRKITSAGVVTTLAGTAGFAGSADGVGPAASFSSPMGIASDKAGNVYVSDTDNNTIRKITTEGVVSTLAGMAGAPGSADGTGALARFDSPQGIAIDSLRNVYVADTHNHTVRKITAEGVVSTVSGVVGQPAFAAGDLPGLLKYPVGVAIDGTSLYITTGNGVAVVTHMPEEQS